MIELTVCSIYCSSNPLGPNITSSASPSKSLRLASSLFGFSLSGGLVGVMAGFARGLETFGFVFED